jgi:glycine/D-amino acid oxidase-like deaminating enzyme
MAVSFWLEQLGPAPAPRPPLAGAREADVCVVGAGLTGLWTALELCRADPALDVVVLEARHAGFGASGRNGGWVVGELSGAPSAWVARGGRDGLRDQVRAIRASVAAVQEAVAREGIACDLHRGGALELATSPLQLARLRARQATEQALGLGEGDDAPVLLDAARAQGRVAVAGLLGARLLPACARVQPAALVRGLADAAERAGATLFEGTPVRRVVPAPRPGTPAVAVTDGGAVRARVVVRATEAYTAALPGLRRVLCPIGSSMVVTEPLDPAAWEALGWAGGECLLDGRHLYAYLQRTADGRVAIGGRGVPYRLGSQTACEGPLPAATARALRDRLVALFPALRGAGIAAGWHGVLGVARDWLPAVGLDRDAGLAWAGGYAGEGVAAANLAGRTLRDLVLGRDSELTRLPWVGPPGRPWEPEPLRWAGVRAVHALLAAADRREARTGRPAPAARLAGALAGR